MSVVGRRPWSRMYWPEPRIQCRSGIIPFRIMKTARNAVVTAPNDSATTVTTAGPMRPVVAGGGVVDRSVATIAALPYRFRNHRGVIGIDDAEVGIDGQRLGQRPALLDDQAVDPPALQGLLPRPLEQQRLDRVGGQLFAVEVEARIDEHLDARRPGDGTAAGLGAHERPQAARHRSTVCGQGGAD